MGVIAVEKPESLGIDLDKLEALRARVQREIDEGLLPSCQFALARDGKLAAFEVFGDATLDTRYVIFSATKVFVASAVWLLIAEGLIEVERPVADYIPEFGANGKAGVTVEQVMLHTSGFPRAPLGPPRWYDRDERVARFGEWRLNWEPGTRFEYHPTSAHWVLAELIERASGQDFRDFVDERVTTPLGLPRLLGLAPEDQDGIADLELRGDPATPDELEAIFGVRELPATEVTDDSLMLSCTAGYRELGIPAGGGIATAANVALFYQSLLHNPDKLWDPELLADVTGRVRNTLPDPLLRNPANRALGVIVAGDPAQATLRGFGHTQSPRTFGHNGAAGQIAWADPETGLSFSYLTNGRDRHMLRDARRTIGITSRAAVCATS